MQGSDNVGVIRSDSAMPAVMPAKYFKQCFRVISVLSLSRILRDQMQMALINTPMIIKIMFNIINPFLKLFLLF